MINRVAGSFRDPSGFLFYRDGVLYRQVNVLYKENYEQLINSGLYDDLVKSQLMIPHEEVANKLVQDADCYKVIKPEIIDFISYPYEWCFSQSKSAALLTLSIQRKALDFGMSLKDCSAYNVQFRGARPVFIDTLSFEKYREGLPWVAYRQFCQHFLAPLALMVERDIRLNQLFRIYIEGIPLDLASSLLPYHTWFKASYLLHIHLHARSQKHFANKKIKITRRKIGRSELLGLIDGLESAISKMNFMPAKSEWSDYYEDSHYSQEAFHHKKQIISEFIDRINPKFVWDLGANIGTFSRIASNKGIKTIAFDNDPVVVEKNYLECIANKDSNLFPLVLDLNNPSAGLGWENKERISLIERGRADLVLALALIHHFAISNNVPFSNIAELLSDICKSLVIEFVPKDDPQIQRLLSTREDIFSDYTQPNFESEFNKYFMIKASENIKDSMRTLYWMENRKL